MNKVLKERGKREQWIDYSKAFAMIFIVWGHICYIESDPLSFYTSYGKINLFYCIAGILNARKTIVKEDLCFKKFFKKKFVSLMIPYYLFSVAAFVINVMCDKWYYNNLSMSKVFDYILTIIMLKGITTLWFLPVLFISEICIYCIDRVGSWTKVFCIIAIPFVLSCTLQYKNVYVVFLLTKIIIAMWFICIGMLIEPLDRCIRTKIHNVFKREKLIECILVLLVFATGFIMCNINGKVDLNNLYLGRNHVIYLVGAILNVYLIICLSKAIKNSNILLEWIGKNTLFIMGTHMPFIILPIIEHFLLKIYMAEVLSLTYYISCLSILGILALAEYILYIMFYKRLMGKLKHHI